jgi:hypothetical protein
VADRATRYQARSALASLLAPLEVGSHKMGSDEAIRAVHQEYLDRKRREFDSLPSFPILY